MEGGPVEGSVALVSMPAHFGENNFVNAAEEATASGLLGIDLGDAQAKEFFQAAAEAPVLGALAEPIEVGLAHVAPEHQLVGPASKKIRSSKIGRELVAVRELVEFDEVIHETPISVQRRTGRISIHYEKRKTARCAGYLGR